MRPKTLIFFDDYPLSSLNVLFLQKLRRKLGDTLGHVETVKTLPGVEDAIKSVEACAIVLDLMAQVPPGFRGKSGFQSNLAGLEILKRCRAGLYGQPNREVPIMMRSARGEAHVRRQCLLEGASGYFLVGTEDERLISALRKALGDKEK